MNPKLAACGRLALAAVATLAIALTATSTARSAGITRAQVWTAQTRAAVREAATERAIPAGRYPRISKDGAWRVAGPSGWASGYAAGILWLEYQTTRQRWWRAHALSREAAIASEPLTADSLNLGVRYYPTFARGFALTGEARLKTIALRAARTLAARYSPTVGALRSRPATDFNVVVDSVMNLPLLYWAVEHGGPPEWSQIAHQHALTLARDFIRADGSTYHLVLYDEATGAVKEKTTADGFAPESMWARGQAWAICGFAACYRKSGDPLLLDAAHRVADRYLADLPDDLVPYWDFRDTAIPASSRDSSAAAIAASGLIDLATTDPDPLLRLKYATSARAILAALSARPYISLGINPALLIRATGFYWRGETRVGASWGDYFYLQALLRLRQLPARHPAFPVARARAGEGDARLAVDGKLDTCWTSSGREHLDLRLEAPARVGAVRLALLHGDRGAARLRILVSEDGIHWSTVKVTMSSGETTGFELYDFPRHEARWVRIACSGTSMSDRNAVAEAEVY